MMGVMRHMLQMSRQQKRQRHATLPTKSLAEKFDVTSQHMVHRVGGKQEGDQKSFKHVQCSITGVTEQVKEAKKRSKDCDWDDICTLSSLEGDLSSEGCSQWWDTLEINILMIGRSATWTK